MVQITSVLKNLIIDFLRDKNLRNNNLKVIYNPLMIENYLMKTQNLIMSIQQK